MSFLLFNFITLLFLSTSQVASTGVCTLNAGTATGDTLFDLTSFSASSPVIKTWTYIVDSKLRVALDETNGGVVGYAWFDRRERIADGFISTFKFTASSSKPNPGDGFTYFIQNQGITDLNGGSGDKLGGFGIGKSIGVRFDFCVDRPNSCNDQEVGLQMFDKNFANIAPPLTPVALVGKPLTNGLEHTVEVAYEGRAKGVNASIRVSLDGTTLFTQVVGDLSSSLLFDSRFAHFGFTSSTSWIETANIDITSWKTVVMPSDSKVVQFVQDGTITFDFGTRQVFTVLLRDTCGTTLTNIFDANITATLFQNPAPETDPDDFVTLFGNVTSNPDGSYSVAFDLPVGFEGSYDLDVLVNGVRAAGMPWLGGVLTVKPSPLGGGFPLWALILLLVLIVLIILVLSYIVYRLHRYQKKLKENAEYIEAGKQQAKLDRLEDGTKYVANPMVGTIDDLKASLAKNEEELARLRKRGELGEDQNYTIEQLQKHRDALLEEMNRLKREEQEAELRRKKNETGLQAGVATRKEFARQQVD